MPFGAKTVPGGSGGPPAPVGRLAPSPTGKLHVGHARSFLLAWWSVRRRGGIVRLRLEDLDAARARPELVDTALRDLEWLGLDWDGEVLRQSADLTPYREAVAGLFASGAAYPCVCSRREILAAASAPHGGEVRYPGTCRDRFADVAAAERAAEGPAGVRLRVAPGPVTVRDALRGDAAFDVEAEVGDLLLARRDGVFAYQLAVVVDDARQGVTEVLRGDDLFSSAARQRLIGAALGLGEPGWVHVPLVVGDDGERLAKRRGDLGLASLREEGLDARALVAWAARSAGVEVDGPLTAAEVAPAFELAGVPAAPARFGESELAEVRAWRA